MSIDAKHHFNLAIAALLGALFWLYRPALDAALVWDDSYLLERYGALSPAQWFSHIFATYYISAEYYRPLVGLSLTMNAWSGEEAFAWQAHLCNLILWLGCVLLVIRLVWHISHQNPYIALSAGLLYGAHPALVEPVAWISGRCDLLATFFVLVALWVEVQCRHRILRPGLIFMVMLVALLSKEAAVVFPVILMAWRFHLDQRAPGIIGMRAIWHWLWQKDNRPYLLLISAVYVAYFLLRAGATGFLLTPHGISSDVRDIGNMINHLLLVGKTFWYFLLLQMLPHIDISVVYPTTYPVPFSDYQGWLGITALLVMILMAANVWWPGINNHNLWVVLALFVPMSNLRPLITHDNFIHLRFLMLPVACTILFFYPAFVAFIWRQKALVKNALLAVVALWALAGIGNIKATLPLWTNEESLWKWAIEDKPDSQIAWENYASAMIAKEDYATCIDAGQMAIQLFPDKPKPYLALTVCYRAIGNEVAARHYAEILLSQPVKRDKGVFSGVLTELAQMDIGELVKHSGSLVSIGETETRHVDKTLQQAITLDPQNKHAATLRVAWLHLQNKNTEVEAAITEMKQNGAAEHMAINTLSHFSFLKPAEQQDLKVLFQRVYAGGKFDR